MTMRNLTLTTIGLPVRTELRLKSMLEVVRNMTLDSWTYCQDGVDADLAICEPSSAMTALAIKRAQSPGAPRCALLIKDELADSPSVPIIRDPIRPTDFLTLLNSISEAKGPIEVSEPAEQRVQTETTTAAADKQNDNAVFALALALRTAAKDSTDNALYFHVANVQLYVVPKTKMVFQPKALDAVDIAALNEIHESFRMDDVSPSRMARLQESTLHRTTISALLWQLGVFGPRDRFVPLVNEGSLFKLRRWPDFGRLEHTADHMRLAAHLARQYLSVAEMVAIVKQPIERIRPFLNACALCELLMTQASTTSMVSTAAMVARESGSSARVPRIKSLFQTIRSALNFST